MTDRVFDKKDWNRILDALGEVYRVFVPVKEGDFYQFKPLEKGVKPDFQFQNTRLSLKSTVLPQSERLFEYSLDDGDPEAHILKESPKDFSPRAYVGVRPCDAHALDLVRINFDNPEYRDPWWLRHRDSTVLAGIGCNEPCATCFCASVGGGPLGVKGLDVLLIDLGEAYLARVLSDEGEAFLDRTGGGRKPTETDSRDAETVTAEAEGKITSHVATEGLPEKSVHELFEAPFWEDVAFPCINCGACTFLCPTCWCFDLQDETRGKAGDRIRNWDTCMSPLFTLHGSGHNPRERKIQRVRQRFMHKLKYFVDKYDKGIACVGCGRCVQFCPVNIDIRQVIRLMNEL